MLARDKGHDTTLHEPDVGHLLLNHIDGHNVWFIVVSWSLTMDQEQVLPELPCDAFRLGEPVHF